MLQETDPAAFADLSKALRSAWTSFVQTGTPTFGLPWPQYQANGRQTMLWASTLGPVGDPAGAVWRNQTATPLPF